MTVLVSQITSLTIVYSTVYSDADQRKHQSSVSLAFVRRIHRVPVNSPYKWPVLACGACDVVVEGQHSFKTWAIPARSVHDVREGPDQLLTESDLAGATYRFIGVDGKLFENFESDGDTNAGIQSIRILRELQANNVAIFIAHDNNGQEKEKSECLAAAIGGAIMALTASIGA